MPEEHWQSIVARLSLSPEQALFIWHALHDSRDEAIAQRMTY
jgi:hypothetical protein